MSNNLAYVLNVAEKITQSGAVKANLLACFYLSIRTNVKEGMRAVV